MLLETRLTEDAKPETFWTQRASAAKNAPREADDHGVVFFPLRVPREHRRLAGGPPRRLRAQPGHGRTQHGNPSAAHLPHDVRRRLRHDRRRIRQFPGDPERWRDGEAVPGLVPLPRGRIPPPVRAQRSPGRGVPGGVLRRVLGPPARGRFPHPVQPQGSGLGVARNHRVPGHGIHRHTNSFRVAYRLCGGSRRARCHLESHRGADRALSPVLDAIGARRPTEDREGRGGFDSLIRQTSPATSLARTVYSCSFMAAGFAEISKYESLITIFSLTFWRNRITDGKPF